ncbi:MAG: 50S ribosomal protein L2 [Parcubacteria group bacterium]|nr:50S ribosomal protein L2 [Parcubacteria group bacterium]
MMKQYKPTTPGRRQFEVADYSVLTKTAPLKSLVKGIKRSAGRSGGRISTRHKGGGMKQLYRMVDFGQSKFGLVGRVEAVEYDPNRTSFIARVLWGDGSRTYILAPQGLVVGQKIEVGEAVLLSLGNRLRLKNIPVGTFVYNVEIVPQAGGAIARSAGNYAEVMAHEGKYTNLKMPSGEVRKVLSDGFASIGQLSRPEHSLVSIGKAGRSRWLGIRPTVRGSAMNPRDHPYGGGEGRAMRGTRKPKTKWGKVTGGRRTRRKKKWSTKLILQRRTR